MVRKKAESYGSRGVGKEVRNVRSKMLGEGAKPAGGGKKGPKKPGLLSRIFGGKKRK